ncbi:MAG: SDR family oxidoreductase [Thermodesulfobacteriota bacterium]|jgi:NAD(P)-dependent dehydrogenase (short-subunit alcohol dehydrogenase family)
MTINKVEMTEKGRGRIEGKVAIVTGTTSGIGEAIALRFAEERAKVIMTGIEPEIGEASAKAINDAGGEATYMNVDSLDQGQVKQMVKTVMDKYDRIDILVNNAGYHIGRHFFESNPDDFWAMINIHGLAHCYTMWEILPIMKKKGSGNVINLGSKASVRPGGFEPFYCFAKAGINIMTKALNMEYGPYGIRMNILCPGATLSRMTVRDSTKDGFAPGFAALKDNLIPLRRHGTPRDQADAALWLASDESSYVAGLTLHVDGGIVV